MSLITEKQKEIELRKKLSIELCDNFTKRLNPLQSKEIKIGAIIAIRNLIKEAKIDDPILISFLLDTITDPDREIKEIIIKVIKEIANPQITKLLEHKLHELPDDVKNEIQELLNTIS